MNGATQRTCRKCGTQLDSEAAEPFCPSCLAETLPLPTDDRRTIKVIPPEIEIHEQIGRYKLLQKIGEGGCGVVYMAEQEQPVCRRVALKIIKLGMDTRQVIARFEAERQALAMMDHPNIAKVLDAGATGTGRPYFVMELVRGIKITDYAGQNHLPIEQRLDLFLQICKAIQHAHQKGIIHRDIKPSNILVTLHDGVPVPKVIDFGIAKATQGRLTEHTLFTAFEQVIGTPAYMSPEQADLSGLDVDTRSDIYSLGVLLYELLTGSTPFEMKELVQSGLDEMRKIIREREPVRPSARLRQTSSAGSGSEQSTLNAVLATDLDWIVMKCLEKDRTRRYETANALAMDIERYLNTEPVAARPPSQIYRLQKLIRRNKLAFGAAAAVAAALLIAMGVSTWLLLKELQTRERAEIAEKDQSRLRGAAEKRRQTETTLRQQAQGNEKTAQSEAAKSQQVAQFLQDMLNGVGPSVAMGRDAAMLREILDKTAERVGKDLTNQPDVEAELRTTIGLVYIEIGDNEKAEATLRQALEIRKKGITALRPQVDRGKTNAERRPLRSIWLGDEDPSVAASLYNLGVVLSVENKLSEAKKMFEEALAINRKLTGSESRETANCLDHLASLADGEGDLAKAETLARQALTMKRKLFVRDHPDIASSLMILASVLNGKNEFSQAEALYREALAMNKKAFSSEHLMVAICVFTLGATLHKEGKLSEAEDMLREALARSDKLLGRENYSVVDVLSELAEVLSEEGKFSEAEEILERKEALLRLQAATALKSSEKSPEKISEPVLRLAGFLQTRRKYAEAERVLNEVLTPAALSQPKSAALQSKLADLHARTGRWKEAAADFSRLIEFEPANHLYYHALAALLATSGDQGSYRGICKKIRDRFGGTTDNPNIADRMAKACLILPALGRDISTENRLADVAVRVGKTPRDEPYFQFCKGLAEYRQGNFENVEDWMRKSLMGTNSWDHIRQVEAYMVLAMAQCQLKRLSDARDSLSKGSEIARDNLPTLESGDIGEGWIDWLIAQALMREAKALIGEELEPNAPAKPEGGGLPGKKSL